jgi:hypothetical protein
VSPLFRHRHHDDVPEERFSRDDIDWPEPREDPPEEPADRHDTIPLDNPPDARWRRRA